MVFDCVGFEKRLSGNLVSFAYTSIHIQATQDTKEPPGKSAAALLSDRGPDRKVGDALAKE